MKHFSFLFLVTFFFSTTYAQLTKRNWLVGGNGSFYSYNETYTSPSSNFDAKYTNIDISASVGYFFADKFVGGIKPTFSLSKGESSSGGKMNNFKLAIGPFLRYYFLNQDKQFNLLTDISYQLGINKNLVGNNDKGKYNTFSAMAGPEIFFNSSAGIEFLMGYSKRITTVENSPDALKSNKGGFQVSIGFQLHLIKD